MQSLHRVEQSDPVMIFASTTRSQAPCYLTSPTVNNSEARLLPIVSPMKRSRKSRIVFDFSTEEMAKYFHMSQRKAAQQLGVATVTVKRNCRRLGIVWPYRLMKSKRHTINRLTISREDAQRIRHERSLARAKASCSLADRIHSQSLESADDKTAANVLTMLNHNQIELTEAGRAFARLPFDCKET
ncbi:Winged helix-turn-helix DNA-binding domain [Plasmopara halstedii]|uniref:Winged helix-turn-helix DNA-binding domain n=1 Tax=Plasmopara halstedii TaxID=4781 RepID=A0A0P1B7I5_PLAHL|nr:Winged helix-turn-helix DNA-binding domain [Plasmopara halstedii]CEG50455.1 Winged helix-turn-helix DNA-binding domain [Plasmopara halstedii]|eukprot:XP_024586824.1 Winged helix-turn-helix DNA-binding domain [Plasmopara halstedii]